MINNIKTIVYHRTLSAPHGYWEHYFTYNELDRTIRRKGYYNNGKLTGYWEYIRKNVTVYLKEFHL
jgi:hypothetical protein